jgi:acetyltransferase-like isoleucine patch superfamily enzyme
MKTIAHFFLLIRRIRKRLLCKILVNLFVNKGKNIIFDPDDYFSFQTISIGHHVYIGPGAYFSSAHSVIKIGSKVMFGPNVSLLGGDHNVSVVGAYMIDVEEKTVLTDAPIIIEDDVWVGANVIILKGVTIGTGSIIAAGAIVNKNIEPNSIVGGVPAKFFKHRFTPSVYSSHVAKLRPIY